MCYNDRTLQTKLWCRILSRHNIHPTTEIAFLITFRNYQKPAQHCKPAKQPREHIETNETNKDTDANDMGAVPIMLIL